MDHQSSSPLRIKVCGMRDPENIAAIAALKPEYMGFIFYQKSPRCTGEDTLSFLIEDKIPDIQKVGVFVNAPTEEVIGAYRTYHLAFVQLHGDETPGYCRALKKSGLRIIKAFGITQQFNFSEVEKYSEVDFFLFDTATSSYGGSGETFPWDSLRHYTNDKPYFLSGGISPDHIQQLKSLDASITPYALDINSRFESSPGYKDIAHVRQFIQNIRS